MERSELSGQSTTDLIRRATEQLSTLVRSELQLAKAELADKGKRAGIGAGMLGGAGLVALYGLAALLAAITLLLALVLPAWAAALIVAGALFLTAVVLALLGRNSLRKGLPPTPERTVASLRADIDAVTTAVADRGAVHHLNSIHSGHSRHNGHNGHNRAVTLNGATLVDNTNRPRP